MLFAIYFNLSNLSKGRFTMKSKFVNYFAICFFLCVQLLGCNNNNNEQNTEQAKNTATTTQEATITSQQPTVSSNKPMRIIMLGAPGSGKGTQAEYIIKAYNIPKISTGDMLRAAVAAKTTLGLQVKADMEAGKLIADDIILSLIKERIAAADCANGYIFDGFPRTLTQAQALLTAGIDIDYVIDIQVPDEEIINRLTGRLVHPGSGRIYHTSFNPPKVAGKDDLTGEALVQRDDDKIEVVKQRLAIYHQQTEPLSAWYQGNINDSPYTGNAKYLQVSGLIGAKEVANEIAKFLAN